ncbi:MAG: AMP-binding protein [Burkholderiaceae bacterium]
MNKPTAARQPRWRDAKFGGCVSARIEQVAPDDTRVMSTEALLDYPARLTDRVEHWAARAPERTVVARRGADGAWQTVSYRQMLARVRALGQALVDRGLGADRPVAILSGNSIEHFTLALACQWVGVPHTPVSPAYALQSGDFGKLRHILARLEPGLVFADDADRFARAIDKAVGDQVEVMSMTGSAGRALTSYADLLQTVPGAIGCGRPTMR